MSGILDMHLLTMSGWIEQTHRWQGLIVEVKQRLIFPGVPGGGISRVPAVAGDTGPGGVPVENAQAATVRHGAHHVHYRAQHGCLSLRRSRVSGSQLALVSDDARP